MSRDVDAAFLTKQLLLLEIRSARFRSSSAEAITPART